MYTVSMQCIVFNVLINHSKNLSLEIYFSWFGIDFINHWKFTLTLIRNSCLQTFFQIGALKNVAIFIEKYLWWGVFLRVTNSPAFWGGDQAFLMQTRIAQLSEIWKPADAVCKMWGIFTLIVPKIYPFI